MTTIWRRQCVVWRARPFQEGEGSGIVAYTELCWRQDLVASNQIAASFHVINKTLRVPRLMGSTKFTLFDAVTSSLHHPRTCLVYAYTRTRIAIPARWSLKVEKKVEYTRKTWIHHRRQKGSESGPSFSGRTSICAKTHPSGSE